MTLLAEWQGEPQTDADLSRKFGETYVYAKSVNYPPSLCYIQQIYKGAAHGIRWLNKEQMKYNFISPGVNFDIIKPMPDVGIHQWSDDGIVLFRKIPARQYHEGVCPETSFLLYNGEHQIRKEAMLMDRLFRLFVDSPDIKIQEGLEKIGKGKALRLNRKYWLKRDKGGDITLFRNRADVGTWSFGKFFPTNEARILGEELKDELDFHA